MNIFYSPEVNGNECILDEKESMHCIRVMRMKKGSFVRLTDGRGNLYEAVITDADPRKCSLRIMGKIQDFERRNYRLHIAISPLKNTERFEWFIEKSVELGIDEITPLICSNSERRNIKKDRLNSLIISAMKQSLKSTVTVLNEPCLFDEFMLNGYGGIRMIAHCSNELPRNKISDVYEKGSDALILIGPEGDFSYEEIKTANNLGFVSVHLGKSRLRSETAGIAACCSMYFLNQ